MLHLLDDRVRIRGGEVGGDADHQVHGHRGADGARAHVLDAPYAVHLTRHAPHGFGIDRDPVDQHGNGAPEQTVGEKQDRSGDANRAQAVEPRMAAGGDSTWCSSMLAKQ